MCSAKADVDTMVLMLASPRMKRMRSDGKPGIERHVSRVDLEHREHRDVSFGALVEQQPDAVAGGDALRDQMARNLVGAAIEFVIGERDGVGDDRVVVAEAKTHLFESVIEPLACLSSATWCRARPEPANARACVEIPRSPPADDAAPCRCNRSRSCTTVAPAGRDLNLPISRVWIVTALQVPSLHARHSGRSDT